MKRSRWEASMGFFLAALIGGPASGAVLPQPGTINYIEGQCSIGGHALGDISAGSVSLRAGQSLSTQTGRAEMLLTPGVFFRIGNNSSVDMISPDLANTIVLLQKGRALVEVTAIRPENNIRIDVDGSSAQLLKPGLYDIDADHGQIRVFDGKAVVQANGKQLTVKGEHELNLNTQATYKAAKFDRKTYEDDFYRWASLRSSYLADANVDAAKRYAGGGGWSPGVWADSGWYWDPAFDAYTFIPGDGIFYSPFGWGYYSPWFAFGAPGFGYFGGFYNHFGPGYRPTHGPGARFPGHASHFGGNSFASGGFGGSRGGGGFHSGAGGFHSGGGFRSGGGGFHGGGFHGGGGGGHGGGGHR
jgi:hypothetical protein